jgi:hypothetical protein
MTLEIMVSRKRSMSARAMLRAFQSIHGPKIDPAMMADLAYVQHKDLDMSVRLGGMLAFNALLITAAINPISASPGAPLSLDAPTQIFEVFLVCTGLLPLVISALLCVRAMLIGEEFSVEGIENNPDAIAQRLFAAYCVSIDQQSAVISRAVNLTVAGGAISLIAWGWIMVEKMIA